MDYNKTVKKKNILLKKTINSVEILSWNKILCDLNFEIVNYRVNFVRELNLYLQNLNKKLLIKYNPSFDISKGISRESFLNQLQDKTGIETRYQRSLIGIHLDDYRFELGGKDLNNSSSGEKKLHLLLIFVALINMYKDHTGEFPVFLLDDYDSAIDDRGLDYLFSIIPDMQLIATSVNNNSRFDNIMKLGA